MITHTPYAAIEATIKNSLQALCLLNKDPVRLELFDEAIDDLKTTIPTIIKYTLFSFQDTCDLANYIQNLMKDPTNQRSVLQIFLKNVYSDVNLVKIGLKYAMDQLYDA
jgi:hypothetical protein